MTEQTEILAEGEVPVTTQKYLQFVTFTVGDKYYSADINQVREIKQWQPATGLPNQAHYTRGVLNLRGTIVPVHDLRARFGGQLTEATHNHVVVIVCIREQIIGILVDSVSDIVTVAENEIRPVPDAGVGQKDMLLGLVETDDGMVAILNLEALFVSDFGDGHE